MSVHLPPSASAPNPDPENDSLLGSSSDDDDDQNWDDWVSDSATKQPCQSLFDNTKLESAEDALKYDREKYGFDLNQAIARLSLDFHGQIRLVNYIRKAKPNVGQLNALTGKESFFTSDEFLIPVLEDDPLLQLSSGDWSDSDDDKPIADPQKRIESLEKKLAQAKQDLADYRAFVSKNLNLAGLADALQEEDTKTTVQPRDDDTHYFESYSENDIHAVMIQDKVRTSTYAHFILSNPLLFSDAVVLDVGCGTGILSLFAARGGAKRVIAVDASDIAQKAKKNVTANGMDDVITVIQGKVENIQLPDDIKQVDIIVSEWMGYALLYESMLDSVLVARDRFLKPGGVMAPSQCKMMLALCDATEIYKDRIGFWNDVYGFDLSEMAKDLYDDAIVDVVGPETLKSKPYTVKDLVTGQITTKELDFFSPFTLISTAEKRMKINAFVLYFDTFFTTHGKPIPSEAEVQITNEHDPILADVWPVGGKNALQRRQSTGGMKEKVTSFSTGPKSTPTHWKQTLFLLREPITVSDDSIVEGTFFCKKRDTNSRELDVEIHYTVRRDPESPKSDVVVQMYKVR
ncbi:hypothetical protein AX16_002244 [Volvariella volvacea WC 439]|nr:hypothetical protein AX16_002244 [Volvariella volvacea WC 439]